MKIDPEQLLDIALQIEEIIENIEVQERENEKLLREVCTEYEASAKNLLHYSTFRTYDLRTVQKKLKRLGLSRFSQCRGEYSGKSYQCAQHSKDDGTTLQGISPQEPIGDRAG